MLLQRYNTDYNKVGLYYKTKKAINSLKAFMIKKISARNICKQFSPNDPYVLDTISYDFFQGEQYAITGRSGSGKSTLLHIIGLLDKPTKGSVLINNQEIKNYSTDAKSQFFNTTIGFLFQTCLFINELSVIENVMLPGMIQKMTQQDRKARAEELLCAVGLIDKKDVFPQSLSGGQQHRTALARALFCKPAFLLADEPTGNLDQETASQIHQLIIDCQQQWHMGLIISTHDPVLISRMKHKILISNGSLSLQSVMGYL